jgi:hypothetical protein
MSTYKFSKQLIAIVLTACIIVGAPRAAVGQAAPAASPPGGDPWPREIAVQGAILQIYQPQLNSWNGNLLDAYAAVGVKNQTTNAMEYGVIWFTALTEVDKVNRLVTLYNLKLTNEKFPTLPDNGASFLTSLSNNLPWTQTIPLDHLESSLATTEAAEQQKKYPVQNDPPQIIFSSLPAILVLTQGQPALGSPTDHLQKVINTRSLIFFDDSRNTYYLALMDDWVQAQSVQGPWSAAKHAPAKDLNRLKQASLENNQNEVMGNAKASLKDAYENGEAPAVYVSTTPAELLLSQGEPQLTPILGTGLLYVQNSGNDIFMNSGDSQYYVLIAGRWFSSPTLANGPWTYVPGTSLPSSFALIPPYSPKASVLVSIPGTPQAKEALIANSIPQTAAIKINAVSLNVQYDGPPNFKPIENTSMLYAANTATPVISVPGNTYYAVQNAVWFLSPNPSGPWTVATSVPSMIYTIPTSSPIHYVTYVQVYGSGANVVYVGYTPGYYGTVVSSDGVVVYGTGYSYPVYINNTVYVPAPTTYGTSAGFSWSQAGGWALAFGIGMAVGASCGPSWGPVGYYGWGYAAPAWGWAGYGGAASANVYGHWGNTAYSGTRAAWANPYTGNVGAGTRGSYYNPVTGASGVGARGTNYNAYTGNYAAGTRAAGYNPSTGMGYAGGRGTVGNAYTGNYASGTRGATYNANTGVVHGGAYGTVGNAYTGQTASVNHGYTYNTKTGNGVGYANGNMYADHNGNVYRSSASGGWQQHSSNGWQNTSSSFNRSSLDSAQSARSQGSQRWSNFHSGGWGGGTGGGGWADRGGWGGGGRSWGGGGFRR